MRAPPYAFLSLPNLLTYVSVAAGAYAVAAVQGPESRALVGICLGVSAIADAFDGRFAGLFSRTEDEKRFGGQIDSLADAIAFGLVPPVCLYRLVSPPAGALRWAWLLAALFYALAAVTRLAYFNLSLDEDEGKTGFVGIPTTVMGLFWALFLLLPPTPLSTAVCLAGGGAAMVSSLQLGRPSLAMRAALLLLALVACVAHALTMRP